MLICHACGMIVRSNVDSCFTCKAVTTPHTPSSLPLIERVQVAVPVPFDAAPQVMDKAVALRAVKDLIDHDFGETLPPIHRFSRQRFNGDEFAAHSSDFGDPSSLDFTPEIDPSYRFVDSDSGQVSDQFSQFDEVEETKFVAPNSMPHLASLAAVAELAAASAPGAMASAAPSAVANAVVADFFASAELVPNLVPTRNARASLAEEKSVAAHVEKVRSSGPPPIGRPGSEPGASDDRIDAIGTGDGEEVIAKLSAVLSDCKNAANQPITKGDEVAEIAEALPAVLAEPEKPNRSEVASAADVSAPTVESTTADPVAEKAETTGVELDADLLGAPKVLPHTADPATIDFFVSTNFVPAKGRQSDADQATTVAERVQLAKALVSPPPFANGEANATPKSESFESEAAEDDAPPKVAPPLGFKPKAKTSNTEIPAAPAVPSELDDDDDDDASHVKATEEEFGPPPRRNFAESNKPKSESDPTKDSLAKRFASLRDDGSPLAKHLASLRGDDSPISKHLATLREQTELFGIEMTKLNKICVLAIMGFIAFVLIQTVCTVLGNVCNLSSDVPISGEWEIVTVTDTPRPARSLGRMRLQRRGNELYGEGKDALGYGVVKPYQIHGEIKGDSVSFRKAYLAPDVQTGQPMRIKPYIQFQGKLQNNNGVGPYVVGKWTAMVAMGAFIHRQMVRYDGKWQAIQVTEPGPQGPMDDEFGKGETENKWRWFWQDWPMHQQFLALAGVAMGVILGVLWLSFSIFGPAGKMNIWEKQKYIPSQFRAPHRKMLKELSKPMHPGALPLGHRLEWKIWKFWEWGHKDLILPASIREKDPHMLVIGGGDKGKSRMMATMIAHDIEANDRAIVVIDSDGGLVEMLTKWVSSHARAKEFTKRITLLDPTHRGGALGYNPLQMPDDGDLQAAASAIVYGFKAIYTEPPGSQSQWNAQTANILRNCALLLMANGKTLTDLPTLLNDNDFRDVLLESIERRKNERAEFITLLDTWGQYKRLARTDQWITWVEPILNRCTPMLGDARIRNILTKSVSDVKLKEVIAKKGILFIKVPKGQLDQNANLLGSLIVTGVKQAALSLANETRMSQNPVALYLDEFDNFIEKDTIETITNETEKFKIGFVGAIKTLQHLPEDFRNQLVIAVGTMACFALGKKDGDMLGPQMFRVDGRKIKHQTMHAFFNKVNAQPTFELITDEEKLNIDRVVGQESRTYFLYRVGTVAGVFHLKSHDFNDTPAKDVNFKLIEKMHRLSPPSQPVTTAPTPPPPVGAGV